MIIRPDEIDYDFFRNMKALDAGKKKSKVKYADGLLCFDIETTSLLDIEQAVMYIWQLQIDDEITVYGRSWEEFKNVFQEINEALPDDLTIVCYVHNLSFEFQWLKSVLPMDDIFAMDTRKVLKFNSDHWEFRCSYLHSNMSLKKYLKAMDVPEDAQKLEYDYKKIRYPWTELSQEEIAYCVNDVRGLRKALINEMHKDHDDLYSIPLTSTGYVRRQAKEAMRKSNYNIKDMLPDRIVFELLRSEFRGGNTHANRWNSNILFRRRTHGEIYSYDISSSYPSVMLTERFPCKFVPCKTEYFKIMYDQGRALLFRIKMFDVKLKNIFWGCPYISRDKCEQIDGGEYDNGRVTSADAIQCVLNEIDFDIIRSEYSFKYEIVLLYSARKVMLPHPFRNMLMQLYRDKTALKGVDDYMYGKQKGKFNSCYGMSVQNPIRPEIRFENGILQEDRFADVDKLIEEYQQNGWFPYQWGCWVTSYARLKLERGLRSIPPEDFLYTDTDSIKFLHNHDIDFQSLNKELIDEDLYAIDADGVVHYIGIFEKENKKSLQAFKTLGAKKYAYLDEHYNLHLTVSGVGKRAGAFELGGIENFNEGFVFETAGGTESVYNDFPPMDSIMVDGHRLQIISNILIRDSTYTLGLTEEYKRVLNALSNIDIKTHLYYDYE